jgi:two-component system sensor histidine kinase/response regulator
MTQSQEEHVIASDLLSRRLPFLNTVWKVVAASVIISDLLSLLLVVLFRQMDIWLPVLAISTVVSFTTSNIASRPVLKYQKIVIDQNLQLARLNRDIREANKKLTENNAELVAFSHTVAHDLKTPLSSIVGFTQLGMLLADQKPKEELVEYFQRSLTASEQAIGIVDSLLLLASAREENVQFTPLDMAEIVQEAWERQYALTQEHHQVTLTTPDEWPVARGYSLWVEGIWSNYLSNAIKYGGRPPVIEVGANVQGDGLIRFWVRDNGDGISPEEQAKLFTPFNKLKTEQIKGHGLGLSIVQRISERLGGSVGVESELGQGSTFYFTLPANAD